MKKAMKNIVDKSRFCNNLRYFSLSNFDKIQVELYENKLTSTQLLNTSNIVETDQSKNMLSHSEVRDKIKDMKLLLENMSVFDFMECLFTSIDIKDITKYRILMSRLNKQIELNQVTNQQFILLFTKSCENSLNNRHHYEIYFKNFKKIIFNQSIIEKISIVNLFSLNGQISQSKQILKKQLVMPKCLTDYKYQIDNSIEIEDCIKLLQSYAISGYKFVTEYEKDYSQILQRDIQENLMTKELSDQQKHQIYILLNLVEKINKQEVMTDEFKDYCTNLVETQSKLMQETETLKKLIGNDIFNNLRYFDLKPVLNVSLSPLYPCLIDVDKRFAFIFTKNSGERIDDKLPNMASLLNKQDGFTDEETRQVRELEETLICIMDESNMPVGNTLIHYIYLQSAGFTVVPVDWSVQWTLETKFLRRKQLDNLMNDNKEIQIAGQEEDQQSETEDEEGNDANLNNKSDRRFFRGSKL